MLDEIQVGYLIVGHTHDLIDQIFSKYSEAMGRQDITSPEQMLDILDGCYREAPAKVLDWPS